MATTEQTGLHSPTIGDHDRPVSNSQSSHHQTHSRQNHSQPSKRHLTHLPILDNQIARQANQPDQTKQADTRARTHQHRHREIGNRLMT